VRMASRAAISAADRSAGRTRDITWSNSQRRCGSRQLRSASTKSSTGAIRSPTSEISVCRTIPTASIAHGLRGDKYFRAGEPAKRGSGLDNPIVSLCVYFHKRIALPGKLLRDFSHRCALTRLGKPTAVAGSDTSPCTRGPPMATDATRRWPLIQHTLARDRHPPAAHHHLDSARAPPSAYCSNYVALQCYLCAVGASMYSRIPATTIKTDTKVSKRRICTLRPRDRFGSAEIIRLGTVPDRVDPPIRMDQPL
jgi:hypothetical protein